MRDGGEEGAGPAEGGDDGGPLDVGHGEDVERGADGQVALQRERQDRQHRGVRGAAIKPSQLMFSIVICYELLFIPFRKERPNFTKCLSERVGVLVPVN